MSGIKKIKTALISVFHKEGLEPLIQKLDALGVNFISTGGTGSYLEGLGKKVTYVENMTGYPSILGGRVKTLHPVIFGGILGRPEMESDWKEMQAHSMSPIDLVIVDLYPFEKTVASGASEDEIIEKIDIGGISLIRAAAKNFSEVLIIPSAARYGELLNILEANGGETTLEERKRFAGYAFAESSHYDTSIHKYFNPYDENHFQISNRNPVVLRYGENPHQKGVFYGDLSHLFTQLHGKEISYNNLLDIEAGIQLIDDFGPVTVGIIKHNNACGLATRTSLKEAWTDALAGDPVSAFGGILVINTEVDPVSAEEIDKLFFEIIIAPSYSAGALEILKKKKNRIILRRNNAVGTPRIFRSLLSGVLCQDRDTVSESSESLSKTTNRFPDKRETEDLLFANRLVKHTKSNAIVLAKNNQLIASGTGQTSRVDALKQAIEKAKTFGFSLEGAVMASDAFFPFADCVEIAHNAGITAVIQPGGSIRDEDSIKFCNDHNMAMVFTGNRHFKH